MTLDLHQSWIFEKRHTHQATDPLKAPSLLMACQLSFQAVPETRLNCQETSFKVTFKSSEDQCIEFIPLLGMAYFYIFSHHFKMMILDRLFQAMYHPSNSDWMFKLITTISKLHGTASTPLKINMETKDYSLEKENHLPFTSIFGFHIHFPGCMILMEIPNPQWHCRLQNSNNGLRPTPMEGSNEWQLLAFCKSLKCRGMFPFCFLNQQGDLKKMLTKKNSPHNDVATWITWMPPNPTLENSKKQRWANFRIWVNNLLMVGWKIVEGHFIHPCIHFHAYHAQAVDITSPTPCGNDAFGVKTLQNYTSVVKKLI